MVPANRAAVVIDTGKVVRRVWIRFDAEQISAKEALDLAGAEPRYSEFGGELGSFVCQLCGHPNPIGDCPSAPDSWAYFQADGDASGFTPSPVGLSSTVVEDGDVEGWAWGTGAPPPFADVDTVCGEVPVEVPSPATTAPPATTGAATSTTATSPAGPDPSGPSETTASTLPTTAPGTSTGVAGPTPGRDEARTGTTTEADDEADPEERDVAAAGSADDEGPSSGTGSPLGVAAVGAIVVAALAWARHLRRRRAPTHSFLV
ncbi:hypothetical protein BH18ACT1_BH18ACT1_02120 [soil metagenome]